MVPLTVGCNKGQVPPVRVAIWWYLVELLNAVLYGTIKKTRGDRYTLYHAVNTNVTSLWWLVTLDNRVVVSVTRSESQAGGTRGEVVFFPSCLVPLLLTSVFHTILTPLVSGLECFGKEHYSEDSACALAQVHCTGSLQPWYTPTCGHHHKLEGNRPPFFAQWLQATPATKADSAYPYQR